MKDGMEGKIFRYMMMAKIESNKSTFIHKIGCVVVNGNVVISKGFNKIRYCKTGGRKYTKFPESLHAERETCRRATKEKLIGSTVYIYRETKDGKSALSYPCEACFKMLNELKIKRIIFSTEIYPFYGEIRL